MCCGGLVAAAWSGLTRGSATRGQPARWWLGEAPLWGARGGIRHGDGDRRRGTRLRAVKRRRSFASEMNDWNVQRPGRGGFEILRSIGSPDTESN
jgi:hypothetical protein